MSMRPADTTPPRPVWVSGCRWYASSLLVVLLLLTGCGERVEDPVVVAMSARDTFWESVERHLRPVSYWTRKVEELEKSVEEAKKVFQGHHDAYRAGLLTRREAVLRAVREAKGRQDETDEARQEAIQQHRTALAHYRDDARDAGRTLRIRLAMLHQAREQLKRAR